MDPALHATLAADYPAPPDTIEVEGLEVACVQIGEGPGLLLIPGLGADASDFWLLIPLLARSFRVLSFDLPGFGLSAKPDLAYDIPFFARVTRGVLARRGMDRPLAVGTSMGGQIALRIAIEDPRALCGMVIADCGGTFEAMEGQRDLVRRLYSETALLERTDDEHRFQMRYYFMDAPAHLDRYFAHRIALLRSGDGPAYARAISRAATAVYDALLSPEELAGLAVRTRVLWGEKDRIISAKEGEKLARAIPGASLTLLPGSGHMPWIEAAPGFAAAVEEFARSLSLIDQGTGIPILHR